MKTEASDLKDKGNECVKAGKFTEAVLHYTPAIKLEPKNELLYSNRSLAFLKIEQYHLALEDAKEAIELNNQWPKGYYRKGEVEFHAGHFTSALMSYKQAQLLDPADGGITVAISKTKQQIRKIGKDIKQSRMLFIIVGTVLGLIILAADQYVAKSSMLNNILLQVSLVGTFGGLGFMCFKGYMYMKHLQQYSLLDAPPDLLAELSGNKNDQHKENIEVKSTERHRKKGSSAAKQRYKMGKT